MLLLLLSNTGTCIPRLGIGLLQNENVTQTKGLFRKKITKIFAKENFLFYSMKSLPGEQRLSSFFILVVFLFVIASIPRCSKPHSKMLIIQVLHGEDLENMFHFCLRYSRVLSNMGSSVAASGVFFDFLDTNPFTFQSAIKSTGGKSSAIRGFSTRNRTLEPCLSKSPLILKYPVRQ